MHRRSVLTAALFAALAPLASARAQWPAPKALATQHLVIYGAEGRRSERIVWLCEELGLPYKLIFKRGDVAGSFATLREINPLMAVAPTVIYDGQMLVESGAIIQLILDREGKGRLLPKVSSPDYPAHLLFMHFAEGTLAADVIADFRTARATTGLAPRGEQTDGQRAMKFADEFLKTHRYFGGADFSAADIMMWFPSDYADRILVADMTLYPRLADWQDRMEARPAFKRMLAAARPDGRVGSTAPLKLK